METAGKQIEDEELRLAMKDAGLGTPATRAETIEKLLRVGYIERLGRALRATAKGRQAIGILHDHALTSAELTGNWEKRLTAIERGQEQRDRFMEDIRRFTTEVVEYFRNLTAEEVRAQRAEIGPCPNGDGIIRENRAAYGCSSWQSKEEPGCGFVIWKQQKGRGISPGRGPRPARARPDRAARRVQDPAEPRPAGAGRGQQGAAGRRGRHAPGRPGRPAREDRRRAPSAARRRDPREQPRLRLLVVEEPQGARAAASSSGSPPRAARSRVDEARQVIEQGASDWMEFKDRKGPFRGRLVLTPEQTVEVQREDEPVATQAA